MVKKKRHKKAAKITHRQAKITPKKKDPALKKDPQYQRQKGKLKIKYDQDENPKERVMIDVPEDDTKNDRKDHIRRTNRC